MPAELSPRAVSLRAEFRLPSGVGWRELVVIAFAASCAFTFGLFFATAVFATGSVLTEVKVGALSTVGAALIAIAAARMLAAKRPKA